MRLILRYILRTAYYPLAIFWIICIIVGGAKWYDICFLIVDIIWALIDIFTRKKRTKETESQETWPSRGDL